MRTQQQWFDGYSAVHQHPRNVALHWLCVPLILWSAVTWLTLAPLAVLATAVVLAVAFYCTLSAPIASSMLAWLLANIALSHMLITAQGARRAAVIALVVFVIAWVGQFIGHAIEGRKPRFLTDLAYLLVGPAWLMHKLLRRSGLYHKDTAVDEVTP